MSWERLERRAGWVAALLLLLFFARLLDTAVRQSVTFDETLHIFQGVLYWREGTLYAVVRNPPLVNALIGLPANLLGQPALPSDLARFADQDWLAISKTFMWETNANGLLLVWAGRLGIIALALFLGALVYRWAAQVTERRVAGLLALFLFTFDPNILAHSPLATTDLGFSFFFVLGGYALWRFWTAVDRGQTAVLPGLLAGIALGLAVAAKFSGLVLLIALLLITLYRYATVRPRRSTAGVLTGLAALLLVAGLTLLAVYRLQVDTLRLDFVLQQAHQLSGHSAYLLGELSRAGWWYYLPVVFLVKTPLPVLILLVWGLWQMARRRDFGWQALWPPLLAGGIFAAALFSRASIGFRYLLPALPLLYISLGRALALYRPRRAGWAVPVTLGWLAVVSLGIHPHYLAFFNALAGGPQNGWRVAVDSNIDWGQDLAQVGKVMEERGDTSVYANWLGTAPLAVYDIPGQTLAGWPWPAEDPLQDPFYPPRPAPGLYALSVTQLLGVYLDDPARFAWFQEHEPETKAGYSIFLYDVAAEGPPVGLGVSGIPLAALAPADYSSAFAGNNVRPGWFDARTSLLWLGGAGEEDVWTAVGEGHIPANELLRALYPPEPALRGRGADGMAYQMFRWAARPSLPAAAAQEALFGDQLRLEAAQLTRMNLARGETLSLLSAWEIAAQLPQETPQLRLFLHVLDDAGQLVAQHDGLDVTLAGLSAGDWFTQLHTLTLPADLADGKYALQIGVYDPQSGARLPLASGGDAWPLGTVQVGRDKA